MTISRNTVPTFAPENEDFGGQSELPRNILLAEDNPADVYLLREALNSRTGAGQVNLIVVTDGEQAMDYVQRRGQFGAALTPDLIVLDLNLPKSDGSDVLRCVREQSEFRTVPVVVLTSSDSPKDRSVAEKLGADCYITKPSDLDAFLALGDTLLRFVGRNGAKSGSAGQA
jgi:CheY-like chemotaxis protein